MHSWNTELWLWYISGITFWSITEISGFLSLSLLTAKLQHAPACPVPCTSVVTKSKPCGLPEAATRFNIMEPTETDSTLEVREMPRIDSRFFHEYSGTYYLPRVYPDSCE